MDVLYKNLRERFDKEMEKRVYYEWHYNSRNRLAKQQIKQIFADLMAVAPQDREQMDRIYHKMLYKLVNHCDGIEYEDIDDEFERMKIDRARRTV